MYQRDVGGWGGWMLCVSKLSLVETNIRLILWCVPDICFWFTKQQEVPPKGISGGVDMNAFCAKVFSNVYVGGE